MFCLLFYLHYNYYDSLSFLSYRTFFMSIQMLTSFSNSLLQLIENEWINNSVVLSHNTTPEGHHSLLISTSLSMTTQAIPYPLNAPSITSMCLQFFVWDSVKCFALVQIDNPRQILADSSWFFSSIWITSTVASGLQALALLQSYLPPCTYRTKYIFPSSPSHHRGTNRLTGKLFVATLKWLWSSCHADWHWNG